MRFFRLLAVAGLVVAAAGVVHADDTKVSMGGGPGGSPTCGSNTASANNAGVLTADCVVTDATGAVTTFSFEVLDANTLNNGLPGGGLTCASNLASMDGWTGTLSAHNPGGVDICTLTAPTTVSLRTYLNLMFTPDPYIGGPTLSTFVNDGDCDLDDFVLGIPVGCDIKVDSVTGSTGLFTPGAPVGLASNNNPLPSLPEPGTLAMLLMGITSLPFLRRKLVR